MRADQLVRSLVVRTGLPHDEVLLVLNTMRDIVYEQIGLLNYVIIPGLLKIGTDDCRSPTRPWKVKFAPLKGLADAVGRDVIRVQRVNPMLRDDPEGKP
jgi:hypothetical protein